jgi:glycine/D-amino acid oxidase-like deaminating enzyme
MMHNQTADVVICGAGIAGIAAAYHLTVVHGLRNVVLVDEHPPLSLTSDKSTECYRNWWPGPGDAMVALMNRSVDLMEQLADATDNRIGLNRRGYLFATADEARIADFRAAAAEAAALGAGPLRWHGPGFADHRETGRQGDRESHHSGLATHFSSSPHLPISSSPISGLSYQPAEFQGYRSRLDGADIITDQGLIRQHFPYLSERTVAVLHARRAGWFSAQQLGMTMLEAARAHGTRLITARLEGVEVQNGRVQAVQLRGEGAPQRIATEHFVNAAGPGFGAVGRMLGLELPVFNELHIKVAFTDHLGVVPRHAPMLIWTDPTPLSWTDEERATLRESPEMAWLLQTFPSGVHARPEGGGNSNILLILWTYHTEPVEPTFPIRLDPDYPEVALRGLAEMLPGLRAYFGRTPPPVVDGGYYTKTRENRPLIGPLPVGGAYAMGAFSGFGLMAACASGELLAAHLTGSPLPHYAPAFALSRYDDPAYQLLLENWGASGQL